MQCISRFCFWNGVGTNQFSCELVCRISSSQNIDSIDDSQTFDRRIAVSIATFGQNKVRYEQEVT